jgi:hypothetical protein
MQPGFFQSSATLSNASAPIQTINPPSTFTVAARAAAHHMTDILARIAIILFIEVSSWSIFLTLLSSGRLVVHGAQLEHCR